MGGARENFRGAKKWKKNACEVCKNWWFCHFYCWNHQIQFNVYTLVIILRVNWRGKKFPQRLPCAAATAQTWNFQGASTLVHHHALSIWFKRGTFPGNDPLDHVTDWCHHCANLKFSECAHLGPSSCAIYLVKGPSSGVPVWIMVPMGVIILWFTELRRVEIMKIMFYIGLDSKLMGQL